MAIVVTALVLCATDNPAEADEAVFAALNACAFDSGNPILDVVTGVIQTVLVDEDYQDGSFVTMVPSANLLRTANPYQLPC